MNNDCTVSKPISTYLRLLMDAPMRYSTIIQKKENFGQRKPSETHTALSHIIFTPALMLYLYPNK